MNRSVFLLIGLFLINTNIFSQDPNFYIYLCFGQSNMEGQGTIETQDRTVDSRFQVMQAVECSTLGRVKGEWYTAVPPLTRCYSGLSPADYFGKTMVDNLPTNIKVGVINVSVAGCKIELFDKENYQTYVSSVTEDWLKNIIAAYDGNPYAYLVDIAKLARQDGVIKGILMHQGESNMGDNQWPSKVKGVYDNLINDLELNPDSVPLLAGEVVDAEQEGICASMNNIIAKLPQVIPNSYVISSSGCTDQVDNLHFDSDGYRKLGTRYALKMLTLYGYDVGEPLDTKNSQSFYFEPECESIGENWDIISDTLASNGRYVTAKDSMDNNLDASTDIENIIEIPFSVEVTGNFDLYGRVNCSGSGSDSYWIKMDDGRFVNRNGLRTNGWQWIKLYSYTLTKGEHNFTIGYRENGAKLDKINITNYTLPPTEMGAEAETICNLKVGVSLIKGLDGYTLGQNYPNPFNKNTSISFEIPHDTYVSLKVFSILGNEITELAGKKYNSGKHTVEFKPVNYPKGIYFYTIKANDYSVSRKMIIQAK